jgi:alkyl hydroperoxide reductase subunit F
MTKDKTYDLIIVGAGPAGITASVYAARKKMDFIVISKDIGGQTAWTGDIENYTGYQFISGMELTGKFREHIEKYAITLKEDEEARNIKKDAGILIETDKGVYRSKTAIVASGKRSRELAVPGEKEFKNKGLTYCATCDGPLFADKDVAVIGGGNSGLDAALQMERIAKHVSIINLAPGLTGDAILQEKIEKSKKITVYNDTQVKAVHGERFVNGIEILSKGEDEVLPVQGVFIEIGLIPNSSCAPGLAKNDRGEIKVNSYNETNLPGIFAAGDVTDVPEKQIIIAAGEGAKAALSAFRYLITQ